MQTQNLKKDSKQIFQIFLNQLIHHPKYTKITKNKSKLEKILKIIFENELKNYQMKTTNNYESILFLKTSNSEKTNIIKMFYQILKQTNIFLAIKTIINQKLNQTPKITNINKENIELILIHENFKQKGFGKYLIEQTIEEKNCENKLLTIKPTTIQTKEIFKQLNFKENKNNKKILEKSPELNKIKLNWEY